MGIFSSTPKIEFWVDNRNNFRVRHRKMLHSQLAYLALAYVVKVAWILAEANIPEYLRLIASLDKLTPKGMALLIDSCCGLTPNLKYSVIAVWGKGINTRLPLAPDDDMVNSVILLLSYVTSTVGDGMKSIIYKISADLADKLGEIDLDVEGLKKMLKHLDKVFLDEIQEVSQRRGF